MNIKLRFWLSGLLLFMLCGLTHAHPCDCSANASTITDRDIQAVKDGRLTLDELFAGAHAPEEQTDAEKVLAVLYGDDEATERQLSEAQQQRELDQAYEDIGLGPARQLRLAVGRDTAPVIGTPQRQAQSNADFIAPKPEPRRFASFAEMAADPEIRRLFKQWLGPGDRYVNNRGKFRTDLTDTRRNSYAGLARRGWSNCRIGKNGMSGFVRYGQAHNTGAGGKAMVDSRGGAWPSSSQTSPAQQGKYESYCELFNQLAPHFIEQGLLED